MSNWRKSILILSPILYYHYRIDILQYDLYFYAFMMRWCLFFQRFCCWKRVLSTQCTHTYSWLAFPILRNKNTVRHRALCQVESADWRLKSVTYQRRPDRCRVNRTYRCPRHIASILARPCLVCGNMLGVWYRCQHQIHKKCLTLCDVTTFLCVI